MNICWTHFVDKVTVSKRGKVALVCPICRKQARDKYRLSAHGREAGRLRCKKFYRHYALLYKYGLTPEQFDELFNKQNRKCAICFTSQFGKRRPHVDHDHTTGQVRGILCTWCNAHLIGVLEKAKKSGTLRRSFVYLGWLNK